MSIMRRGPNLMIKVNNLSSLAMTQTLNDTSCTIQPMRRLSIDEMWSSMKENGIRVHMMKTTNFLSQWRDVEQRRMEQEREGPTTPYFHQPQALKGIHHHLQAEVKKVPHFRSLHELYEVTKNQNNLTPFCLFTYCEPMNFREDVKFKKWKEAID